MFILLIGMRRRNVAGRESELLRGYIQGVAAMMNLITSDKVKRLDKTNVLQYARELVEAKKEETNAPSR
jgi:hypothetical protein